MAQVMRNVVISGDIHAHNYKGFNSGRSRLENVLRLIEELFDRARKEKADLWIVGDLFNTMQTIQTATIVSVISLFKRKLDEDPYINVIMISGNHDQATKNTTDTPAITALDTVAELSDRVHLIDNWYYSCDDYTVFGIPYYPEPEDFEKVLRQHTEMASKLSHEPVYLMMHQTVGLNISMVPDDFDPGHTLFDEYDLIFNGHIHTPSEVRAHFINVGSPIHRDAGDIGQEKSYILLNTKKVVYERIKTEGYPVFRHLPPGQSLPEDWEGDYIIEAPDQIQVSPEEEEIREKFDHTKTSKRELLHNFVEVKLSQDPELKDLEKDIYAFGEELLQYADQV